MSRRRRVVVAAVVAAVGGLVIAPATSGAWPGRGDHGGRPQGGWPGQQAAATTEATPPPADPPPADPGQAQAQAQPQVVPQTGDFWVDGGAMPGGSLLTIAVLNRTNGRYPDDQVFWSFNGQTHSIAEQPFVDVGAAPSARMYFHLGDPNGQYTDFIEFNSDGKSFYGNTTRVDGFGLKLAMRLHGHGGDDIEVGENRSTFAEDRGTTFKRYTDAVPDPFKGLVQGDTRIASPLTGGAAFQNGGYAVDGVPLAEAAGCSGAVAGQSAYCAALNRGVGGDQSAWNDPGRFYPAGSAANWYAKFWHDNSINGLTYGFATDDQAGQSSMVGSQDPQWLQVAVGW